MDSADKARTKAAVAVALALASLLPAAPPKKETTPPSKVEVKKAAPKVNKPRPRKAVGVVLFRYKEGAGMRKGSGTVIGPRRKSGRWHVLTCAHAVGDAKEGTIEIMEKVYNITVEAVDKTSDIAWCATGTDAPDDLPYALLATKEPRKGDDVWHCGWGVYTPGDLEVGKVVRVDEGWIGTTLPTSSGDSGAAIFNWKDEVVGVVCTSTFVPGPGYGSGRGVLAALKNRKKIKTVTKGSKPLGKPLDVPKKKPPVVVPKPLGGATPVPVLPFNSYPQWGNQRQRLIVPGLRAAPNCPPGG